MSILDDDIEAIFENSPFAVCAEFTLGDGSTVCVKGEFTDATDETRVFGNEIEAQRPTLMCLTAAVADIVPKLAVEIDGTAYQVERKETVGAGVSVVYLKT